MKNYIELYRNLSPITQYLIHFLFILSISIILVSLFCFMLAEYSRFYYDMKILSSEMIILLRSSFFTISIGTIFTELLEKKKVN